MHIRELASYVIDLVFPPRDTARVVRAIQEDEFLTLVSPRLTNGIVSLLPYRHPLVRATILEAKFKRNEKAIRLLGRVLREYLEAEGINPIIVPVPLGKKRYRERGYNQVELIARVSGYSVENLLTRVRETQAQTSLSRDRRLLNVQDAFRLKETLSSEHTYILLDDVMTTGATLEAVRLLIPRAIALAH